jgi:hypothetical protein
MGYLPIGIGWGKDFQVRNNFIYMRGFSPTQRSTEYSRSSSIAGIRYTNYDGSDPYENLIYEDNVIVLKPEAGCYLARGIWTNNGVYDKNIVYRRNTVKVEAMPGNLKNPEDGARLTNNDPAPYYNGEVNYAITAVTFTGSLVNKEGDVIADPIIFEDNRLIGNVNLITVGEGYGICNSVWMYRTKLEKIDHDSEFFRPVRIGFWYWDTWNNRMIDTETDLSEKEMTPFFFGGTGRMEMRYGKSKTVTIKDGNGSPVANKSFTLTTPDDNYTQTLKTDGNGKVTFDLLTVRYHKWGDSRDGGVKGTVAQTDYEQYVFNVSGYKPLSVPLAQLASSGELKIEN